MQCCCGFQALEPMTRHAPPKIPWLPDAHYAAVKRAFDVIAAAIILVVMAPLLGGAALAIRIVMGAPVLFRQDRIGHKERTFTLLKFRTMRAAFGLDGKPLPDVQRLGRLGAFLRRMSIDELPQLINVVRGEMSLVGPRPLFVRYLRYYTDRERLRHSVRPGITGLAQVSGRNHLLWDERLELDVRYVESVSLMTDLKILTRTAQLLLSRGDVIVVPGLVQGPLDQYRTPRHLGDAGRVGE
jgi:lipopolysaccharide/colanic/teichoic acid biosynthesis glycosyltransferase